MIELLDQLDQKYIDKDKVNDILNKLIEINDKFDATNQKADGQSDNN